METWPSSLTGFTDDFSIQPNTVAEKNMTDGGVNHAFSRWTSDIVEISGTLHFGQDDLAVFKTFYRDTIKNGTESFYLTDFPIFGDYETHKVVFKEHPDISYAAWMEWDVSVTLLSNDLGYITKGEMDALLPEEPEDDYVTFPESVFGELTDDFGWKQEDLVARGNTEGGDFPFSKRISHVSSTTAQCGIEVSHANMNLFYAWGLYKLAGFKKWFKLITPNEYSIGNLPVITKHPVDKLISSNDSFSLTVEAKEGGVASIVRFSSPPSATFKGTGNNNEGLWEIKGEIEIYEKNYFSLSDCDFLPVRTGGPTITSQPSDDYVLIGNSSYFQVSAEKDTSDTSELSYQWYEIYDSSSHILEGETEDTLSFSVTDASRSGHIYFVVVKTDYGSAISSNAVLHVASITITQHPSDLLVNTGGDISLSVSASETIYN